MIDSINKTRKIIISFFWDSAKFNNHVVDMRRIQGNKLWYVLPKRARLLFEFTGNFNNNLARKLCAGDVIYINFSVILTPLNRCFILIAKRVINNRHGYAFAFRRAGYASHFSSLIILTFTQLAATSLFIPLSRSSCPFLYFYINIIFAGPGERSVR